MSDLPDPLTPPDCDLRGLEFMPLDTVRLLDSDLFALSTGEEFKAALALWCKSWTQVPAGSLPKDDRVLAHLSGAGSGWRKVKELALRNWMECSDGRLYHPVVAEKALEALPRRKAFQEEKTASATRKERERVDRKAMFERLREVGVVMPYDTKTSELRSRADALVSRGDGVTGHGEAVTSGVSGHAQVTAKTGTGTGTIPPTPREVTPGPSDLQAVMKAGGMITQPSDYGLLREWLALPNMQLERDILPIVERKGRELIASTGKAPFKLKFFDPYIREQQTADEAEIARLRDIADRSARQEERQRIERETVQ